MKKLFSKGAFIAGLVMAAFMLFAVVHNKVNNRFTVVHFKEIKRVGYESDPAATKVEISPALAFAHTPTAPIVIGFVFLGLFLLAVWFVDNDYHLGKKKDTGSMDKREGLAFLIILIPLLLSAVCFFGWYSGRQANNYVTIERTRFDNMENSGAIKKKGENTYTDPVDSLKNLFEGKQFIR
jgi:hypothetical protein